MLDEHTLFLMMWIFQFFFVFTAPPLPTSFPLNCDFGIHCVGSWSGCFWVVFVVSPKFFLWPFPSLECLASSFSHASPPSLPFFSLKKKKKRIFFLREYQMYTTVDRTTSWTPIYQSSSCNNDQFLAPFFPSVPFATLLSLFPSVILKQISDILSFQP